jgi:hypothetical protein
MNDVVDTGLEVSGWSNVREESLKHRKRLRIERGLDNTTPSSPYDPRPEKKLSDSQEA